MTNLSGSTVDSSTRAKLLQAIVASGQRQRIDTKLPVNRSRFLENYYALSDEEVLSADPKMLARAALGHLEWARIRKPKTAKIRIFNPTPERDGWISEHTIIQTVNDNMPFLVDSLTMTLNSMGRGVHIKIHPILQVIRNSSGRLVDLTGLSSGQVESFIQLEIERETQAAKLKDIEQTLVRTLQHVRAAVDDWEKMVNQLRAAADELSASKTHASELKKESCEFLEWLAADHFTLLGYLEFDLLRGAKVDELKPRPDSVLGILREEVQSTKTTTLTGQARKQARSANPLVITKANRTSSVHRPAPLDHIGVKVFDQQGQPCAERRFLGLFTSVAYNENPRDIPLLRLKVRQIMKRSGLDARSHRGKALQHILNTFPRDDLIQGSLPDLSRISIGILGLQERHRVSLFCRRDIFGRFYSCLIYLPRDQYSVKARRRIESLLLRGLNGTSARSELAISESALARLAVIVKTKPEQRSRCDIKKLESELREAVRTWGDKLRHTLLSEFPESRALELLNRFGDHFPTAYQEAADAQRASNDIRKLALLIEGSDDLQMTLTRSASQTKAALRFTTFHCDEPIQLYLAHPILENMGLKVIAENNYTIQLQPRSIWIQDFELEPASPIDVDPAVIESRFQECFARTLRNEVENDRFNSFVVTAGLDWREAALLRAYCKYILQTGNRFSQSYMQFVLEQYPAFCRALIDHFHGLFDPNLADQARTKKRAESDRILQKELDRAVSLDDDRILNSFKSAVQATLRTNFFQLEAGAPKPYLSLKFDPKTILELPRPRPQFEVFVYSKRMEGVHLRCGPIARGGIRWSDRREDFRTEILGLMKAQQVKNTVIVPAGAKGGFVCKTLPTGGRAALQAEVVDCYRTFIRALLDVTDNIVDENLVPPQRVVARDSHDPYLVVAADKGTATFSDIANELSQQYGFWLGDAFASGGSTGYDHKKMAITARGAWEAVKRHFREIGIDTQEQDFTAIGIGDMAGDVFGNGMLLTRHIKLIAAFNHQHIFLDPDPDCSVSYDERKRLFELPRSSWNDYDRKKISLGGGVYSRDSKSIELHEAARSMLGLDGSKLSPPELIRAILTARADLLWNGGIGTYVKATNEGHIDASDPVNDSVRVNGNELNCRVIGEGGNLGLTQLGRVEYALSGGRLNADFIDNSGGVDSSDREVNIKILLNDAIRHHKLAKNKRAALLASMTEDVAELVLANNYAQTQALSMMASRATERIGEHARVIRVLESRGLLDRQLEFLPNEEEIAERKKRGSGLTRPELAVILSYSKIELSASLAATDIPEDPFCAAELETYFPKHLSQRFKRLIHRHRLRREILAMLISSSMINRMGPFFVLRAEEETGANVAQVARAYAIARKIFGTRDLWRNIEAQDHAVQAQVQYDSIFQISRMLRRAVYWFLQRYPNDLDIEHMVKRMRPGVSRLIGSLATVLSGHTKKRFENDTRQFEDLGLPRPISQQIASLSVMTQILDIVELAEERGLKVKDSAQLYFDLGRGLRLDWIRDQIEELTVEGRWRAIARATLRETLAEKQRALVRCVLDHRQRKDPRSALSAWLSDTKDEIARTQRTLDDMMSTGQMDFATLSVALKEVNRLV